MQEIIDQLEGIQIKIAKMLWRIGTYYHDGSYFCRFCRKKHKNFEYWAKCEVKCQKKHKNLVLK